MYPGNRNRNKVKSKDSSTKKWDEQDDAFFGPNKPTWLSSSSSSGTTTRGGGGGGGASKPKPAVTISSSARRTTVTKQPHVKNSTRKQFNEKESLDNQIRVAATKQKERISNIAKKAASKFSDFIETSNENSSTAYANNTRSKSNSNAKLGNANETYKKGAGGHTSKSNSNNSNNHTEGERKYKKVPVPSEFNAKSFARTAKNALLSQVPLPCAHCRAIPLMYQISHFHGQRICSTHDFASLPKCLSCYKVEPKHAPFHEIGTTGSLLCPPCARTAILDNGAARELYNEILSFFQSYDLDMFRGMTSIPINLVTTQEMKANFSTFKDTGSADKYGVCCYSEIHSPLGAAVGIIGAAGAAAAKGVQKFVQNQKNKGRLKQGQGEDTNHSSSTSGNGGTKRNLLGAGRFVFVTQIAALKGLPRIYLGQVLAHEATHAWLALNPTRKQGVEGEKLEFLGVVRKLPTLVEEGCCQLVAHLYLDSLPRNNRTSDEALLVEFCSWSIEHHSTYEYGEGYKQAAMAYNHIIDNGGSLGDLLEYVSIHMAFPPCS